METDKVAKPKFQYNRKIQQLHTLKSDISITTENFINFNSVQSDESE